MRFIEVATPVQDQLSQFSGKVVIEPFITNDRHAQLGIFGQKAVHSVLRDNDGQESVIVKRTNVGVLKIPAGRTKALGLPVVVKGTYDVPDITDDTCTVNEVVAGEDILGKRHMGNADTFSSF